MQRLIYNLSGQTLSHVPDVRRASATWVLEDLLVGIDSAARTLDSGSVNVDAATEATTAEAGPQTADPREVTVASTAGFVVGTTYEIVSVEGAGDRELVVLAGLATNASLRFEHPLIGTYPSGSTVQGITLTTAAIINAVVQNEQIMQDDRPMRIVWTYPDGSRAQEAIRLVRDDRGDLLIAPVVDIVRTWFPDIDTRMTKHGRDTLVPIVRLFLRQFRTDMLGRGELIEGFLTGDKGLFALAWRVLWHLAQSGNTPSTDTYNNGATEWKTYCKGEYERYWHALTIGEGGKEVVKIEPTTATAPASHDVTYRAVIMEL